MSDKTIFVVDDDPDVRDSLHALLVTAGYKVLDFENALDFLAANHALGSCLISDIRMPQMNGVELLESLVRRGSHLPVIIITGHGDVALAVRAMRAGAVDFVEKPFDADMMLESVTRALEIGRRKRDTAREAALASEQLSRLTPREVQVFEQLVAGKSNKLAAYELKISPRTVEIHRARIMDKLHAKSLSDLVRASVAAQGGRGAGGRGARQ